MGTEGCRAFEANSHNVFVTKACLRSFQGVLFVCLALICGPLVNFSCGCLYPLRPSPAPTPEIELIHERSRQFSASVLVPEFCCWPLLGHTRQAAEMLSSSWCAAGQAGATPLRSRI